jgi:hypothetical protein
MATYEHVDSALSPTRNLWKPGEAGKGNLDTPGFGVPEEPGARATSPGAALPGTSMLMPHLTKSHNKPSTPSPS